MSEILGAETPREWWGFPFLALYDPLSPLTNYLIGWTAKVYWSPTKLQFSIKQ